MSDQSVERRELLLRPKRGRDVVRGIALLQVRGRVHGPVSVLWHKRVDCDGFGLNPGLESVYNHNKDIIISFLKTIKSPIKKQKAYCGEDYLYRLSLKHLHFLSEILICLNRQQSKHLLHNHARINNSLLQE